MGKPALPPDNCNTEKARTEQRDRCRLGHCLCDFGDHDFTVASLEIGHQDLVRASVKGAPATTDTITRVAANTPPPPL
jgi:hypothetical protein